MKKFPRLIVFEGSDGSGKATQAQLLFDRLQKGKIVTARKVSFPNYDSNSSALVKLYLQGELGNNPAEINPYASAAFYAADRFITFQTQIKKDFLSGTTLISDRYVPSNMIHQAVKIEDEFEREKFLNWLDDLEYEKFQLPRPSLVFLLDMNPEMTQKLMKMRGGAADIHEKDLEYQKKCHDLSLELAKKFGWKIIQCMNRDELRKTWEIQDEIYSIIEMSMLDRSRR